MIYENLNARNSDTIRGIRHLPSAIVMKKSIQIGKKLHRTLAEPMQEQYTSIEEKCNKCQKSSFILNYSRGLVFPKPMSQSFEINL